MSRQQHEPHRDGTTTQNERTGAEQKQDGESVAGATTAAGGRSTTEQSERASEGSNTTDSEAVGETDSTTISPRKATYTARFAGFVLLLTVLTAVGALAYHPAAIAAAGALLVFLAAGLAQTPTAPADHLTVSYDVTSEHPRPAERVTVTVTVENTGEATFTDLRLVDTVPDDIRVISGSPRMIHALRPGETATLEYTVSARRGTYSFGPVVARTRTLIGSMWVEEELPTESPVQIRCAVRADDIPLEEEATHYIGGLLGDNGGDGVEFYATREYHRGDPPSKINWREFAKRGELSTITYREQQAADITIIADARMWSRVSAGSGTPSAAILGMYAAYQLTTTLTGHGHYVGMVVPGMQPNEAREQGAHSFPYRRVEHGRGMDKQQQAFELLDAVERTVETEAYSPDDAAPLRDFGTGNFREGRDGDSVFDVNPYQVPISGFVQDLTTWASENTQFIFITPLLDAGAHGLCSQLQSMGYPIVVISPDVTKPPSDGAVLPARVMSVQRATRVESLRQQGVTVIDWDPEEPLSVCCERQTLPGDG